MCSLRAYLNSLRCRATALVVKAAVFCRDSYTSTYKLFALPFSFLAAAPHSLGSAREIENVSSSRLTLHTTE